MRRDHSTVPGLLKICFSSKKSNPHAVFLLKCHQWVFLEPPTRSDAIKLTRSAEHPACVVVTVPGNVSSASVALEFRLSKHEHRYITRGAQTALESTWSNLPVTQKIQRGLFVASEARKLMFLVLFLFSFINVSWAGGYCERQEMDTQVRKKLSLSLI